jgi:hypothetical protein
VSIWQNIEQLAGHISQGQLRHRSPSLESLLFLDLFSAWGGGTLLGGWGWAVGLLKMPVAGFPHETKCNPEGLDGSFRDLNWRHTTSAYQLFYETLHLLRTQHPSSADPGNHSLRD